MELHELYDIAENDNIAVESFEMSQCEAISLMNGTDCYIAIDPFKLKSENDEKVKLAHEMGHCETGSFYNQFSSCDIRAKHERRAEKWAIKKLIPKDELIKAFKTCFCNTIHELSEYFNVTEDFMQKALEYYKNRMN